MTWSKDDWTCQVCEQYTLKTGPWCKLYLGERGVVCPPALAELINQADSIGDGPAVNAYCQYAREHYGEGLYW
jgi:hypothetical protein